MTEPESAGAQILICDDEPDLREMVGEYLAKRGHTVSLADGGVALRARFADQPLPEIVLLDITMPGEDGLSVLRWIRSEHEVPVIMVTAAGETIDRVVGLELGADDYLPKPIDLRELEARVRAVLRRGGSASRPSGAPQKDPTLPAPGPQSLTFSGLTLHVDEARLTGRHGEDIPLTAMEFRLLKVFADRPGRALNRDQLLELAHDRGWDPFDRSIDIRISRLRRKIERIPSKPSLIRTVRGIGYVFDPDG